MACIRILATAGAMLIAGSALAAESQGETSIRNLPDTGMVTLSGTVAKVKNEREFTLRDNSGAIDVKVASGESAVLKEGDSVTVTGAIERPWMGLMGKDINANKVEVRKDLATTLTDAVSSATGLALDKAQPVQIGQLPDEGMVKLSGTVDDVDNEKNFTLRDHTGKVDVTIQSEENVVLAKGTEVTVIGYVNNGALGKKLRATHVVVNANAMSPAAGGNPNE